jgi:hypothetical protein
VDQVFAIPFPFFVQVATALGAMTFVLPSFTFVHVVIVDGADGAACASPNPPHAATTPSPVPSAIHRFTPRRCVIPELPCS